MTDLAQCTGATCEQSQEFSVDFRQLTISQAVAGTRSEVGISAQVPESPGTAQLARNEN
jgi:hypothetical protein